MKLNSKMEDAIQYIKMISPYAKVVHFVVVKIEYRGGYGPQVFSSEFIPETHHPNATNEAS